MKITHNKIGQNINLTDSSKSEKAKENNPLSSLGSSSKTSAADKIKDLSQSSSESVKLDISPRAQDIKYAKELAMGSPDVDQDKVEKFRKLIDEGKYKVDAKAVADRLVDEHMFIAKSGATGNE